MSKKEKIVPKHLTYLAIGSMLGSGFLFAPTKVASLNGVWSIISWVTGMIFILLIALMSAETSSMFPGAYSSNKVPTEAFGKLAGFLSTWISLIICFLFPVVEVFAVVSYLSFYFPSLSHGGSISMHGEILGCFLLFFIAILNMSHSERFLKISTNITLFKILIPLFIAVVLIFHSIHHGGHHAAFSSHYIGNFKVSNTLTSIVAGGIIFSFYGFKNASDMAVDIGNNKSKAFWNILNPIFICGIIFILMQLAFLLNIKHSDLNHGWGQMPYIKSTLAPLSVMISKSHLSSFFIFLISFIAVVSPFGAALIYFKVANESVISMIAHKQIPHINSKLIIFINLFITIVLFLVIKNWYEIANFMAILFLLTFLFAPICLIKLRRKKIKHFFRVPFAKTLSVFITFLILSLVSMEKTIYILVDFIVIMLGVLVHLIFELRIKKLKISAIKGIFWFIFVFISMLIFSFLKHSYNISNAVSSIIVFLISISTLTISFYNKG